MREEATSRVRPKYLYLRKEAMTRAITYWMTLFPWRTQVSLYETRNRGSGLSLLDDPVRRNQDMRKEAMTQANTYWMTLFP
jgi:hypothetical protein